MLALVLPLALVLASGIRQGAELRSEAIADIRVQGNTLTSDEEVRQLAGVEIGMPVGPSTIQEITARLRAAKRFERVDVLKRFASIADPTQVSLVIIVNEGPVHIEVSDEPGHPTRVVRNRGPGLLFLPIVDGEDGYGITYGTRIAWRDRVGARSHLSFPLTWGGDKRAAVEFNKKVEHGLLERVFAGASIARRENPFFNADDSRRRVWLRGEKDVARFVRAGGSAGWQQASFLGARESFSHAGADITLDTRLDPILPRNALYARASIERLELDVGSLNRTQLEGRGYVGLVGQTTLALRALREDASRPLPLYLESLLGGTANLRGFRTGTAAGDTLVSGSVEVVAPLTSPLRIARLGVSVFADAGTVYREGEGLAGRSFRQGYGGSVWLTAAFLRLNIAVAHGVGASTRVHVGGGVSF